MATGDLFDDDDENAPSGRAPSPFSGEATDAARERAEKRLGRPPGARNKRDLDFERWYFAMGYTDPAQRLAELMSEDPLVLYTWFREHSAAGEAPTLLDVVELQRKAEADLMPYLHGKKTPELSVAIEALPMLVINAGTNQLDQAREIAGRRALSVGAPLGAGEAAPADGAEKASESKDLEGGR